MNLTTSAPHTHTIRPGSGTHTSLVIQKSALRNTLTHLSLRYKHRAWFGLVGTQQKTPSAGTKCASEGEVAQVAPIMLDHMTLIDAELLLCASLCQQLSSPSPRWSLTLRPGHSTNLSLPNEGCNKLAPCLSCLLASAIIH